MAYKVTDICTGCCVCLEHCPAEAISIDAGKAIINSFDCIECGSCVAACPLENVIVEEWLST